METGRVAKDCIPCPMHGCVFNGDGHAASPRADVTTYFDSPLNTYLQTRSGDNTADLCNFLTIIEGKQCRLTQVGVGRRTKNPVDWAANAVSYVGSWFATYEDAAVWNNRKVQEPDNHPHQTDKVLEAFRTWFEGFAYAPQST